MFKSLENATPKLLEIKGLVLKSVGEFQAIPAFGKRLEGVRRQADACVFPGEVQRYIHTGVERPRELLSQHCIW